MDAKAKKSESLALRCARAALVMMVERNIDPNPVNYTVWYHYINRDIRGLNEEIDKLLKTKSLSITDDVSLYLYNKYIILPTQQEEKVVEAASQNAQTVLGEVMGIIERFSGDTQTYNQQIDSHVNDLNTKINDPALKEMAREIINRAVAIRDSGAALNEKLEESRKEVAQLKNTLEKTTSEANRDFLTGVANRKALEKKLEELTKWAAANKGELCLLMIDIDHFKNFNDKYGHLIGDEVLKRVGAALTESVKG